MRLSYGICLFKDLVGTLVIEYFQEGVQFRKIIKDNHQTERENVIGENWFRLRSPPARCPRQPPPQERILSVQYFKFRMIIFL
jgi:hypothetical protein